MNINQTTEMGILNILKENFQEDTIKSIEVFAFKRM